jgi:hypothetical protein
MLKGWPYERMGKQNRLLRKIVFSFLEFLN